MCVSECAYCALMILCVCTGERECVVGMRERGRCIVVFFRQTMHKTYECGSTSQKKKERGRGVHKLAIFLASHEVMAISVQTTFNLTKYDVISTIVM